MTQHNARQSSPAEPVPARERWAGWDYVIRADDPGWDDDGGSLPYYDTSMVRPRDAWGFDGWIPVLMPDLLLFGEYVGSSVEESNRRVFMEQYGSIPGVFEYFGGYGARGVILTPWALAWVIEGDPSGCEMWSTSHVKTLQDVLDELSDYCVLDEEALSEVEREREDGAWDDSGYGYCRDFRQALSKRDGFTFVEDWDTTSSRQGELLWMLCHELMDVTNTYWTHETGNSVYLDVERIAAGLTPELFSKVTGLDPSREQARYQAELRLMAGGL